MRVRGPRGETITPWSSERLDSVTALSSLSRCLSAFEQCFTSSCYSTLVSNSQCHHLLMKFKGKSRGWAFRANVPEIQALTVNRDELTEQAQICPVTLH